MLFTVAPVLSAPESTPRATPETSRPLLQVQDLSLQFGTAEQPLSALDRVSFEVFRGETVCLVGESGCGKTVSALSALRVEEHRHGTITGGEISFDGYSMVGRSEAELDTLRGRRVAMIFQEPMTAFDPVFTVGHQIAETIRRHERVSRKVAWERGIKLLDRVHITDPDLRMHQIPEELSGGMRQRAMIAMALACGPELLIADEPTTALDVTIQAQILALLKELQREYGMALLLITHDLGVAAEMADRIVVMYAGRVVEQAPTEELFANPRHPYTRGLLSSSINPDLPRGARLSGIEGSIPRLDELPSGCRFHPRCAYQFAECRDQVPPLVRSGAREVACFRPLEPATIHSQRLAAAPSEPPPALPTAKAPLVEARQLSKDFVSRSGWLGKRVHVHALDRVSLAIQPGETLGLVGESGCGKSTLGRVLLQLEPQTSGEVFFQGKSIDQLLSGERKLLRREMQMIFQDPYGSIDPRWTIGDVIAEPIVSLTDLSPAAVLDRVKELLALVGLDPSLHERFPHEFSGGQRQRIGIARAIALNPKFVVVDEGVSALDLSVQAQILNLFASLREQLGLTSLFIGHGLHLVRHVSDRIGVMYLGRLVELAPADELFKYPAHHYTQALLSAVPVPDPKRRRDFVAPLGELPSMTSPPSGCHFHPRCPAATERCKREAPELVTTPTDRSFACHFPLSGLGRAVSTTLISERLRAPAR